MIISRKRFEEELCKRRQKEEFDRRVEERLFALDDEVRTLKWKVDTLERERNPNPVTPAYTQPQTYDPVPYWTNPSWKAPDVTCTTAESEGE